MRTRIEAVFVALVATGLWAGCDGSVDVTTGQGGTGAGQSTASGAQGGGGSTSVGGTSSVGGGTSVGGTSSVGGGTTTSTTTTTTTTTTGVGGGGSGMGGGTAVSCQVQPTTGMTFAVDHLLLGDTNPDGTSSAVAWKQYGFDIDGVASTGQSVGLCKPNSGGNPNAVYPDGNAGIDNAFGKNILPIFTALSADYSAQLNDNIAQGNQTVLLHLDGLLAGADQSPITAMLYGGAPLLTPPAFDGNDCWTVEPGDVTNPADLSSAKALCPASVLTANHWESGIAPTLVIDIGAAGFPIELTVHDVRVSMDLDAAHGNAMNGRIGGVIDTEELVQIIKIIGGTFDPSLCSGSTIESIAVQVRQASDILLDGTQDPAVVCNGISIGLGFHAVAVNIGQVAPAGPPLADPCAP